MKLSASLKEDIQKKERQIEDPHPSPPPHLWEKLPKNPVSSVFLTWTSIEEGSQAGCLFFPAPVIVEDWMTSQVKVTTYEGLVAVLAPLNSFWSRQFAGNLIFDIQYNIVQDIESIGHENEIQKGNACFNGDLTMSSWHAFKGLMYNHLNFREIAFLTG